jgi:hypothetical protein
MYSKRDLAITFSPHPPLLLLFTIPSTFSRSVLSRKIVYRISTKKLSLACDLNDEHHRNSAYEAEFYTSHEPVKVHSNRTGNEPLWFSVPADTFFDEFQQWWQGIAGNELPSKEAFDSEESERDATTVEPAPESV